VSIVLVLVESRRSSIVKSIKMPLKSPTYLFTSKSATTVPKSFKANHTFKTTKHTLKHQLVFHEAFATQKLQISRTMSYYEYEDDRREDDYDYEGEEVVREEEVDDVEEEDVRREDMNEGYVENEYVDEDYVDQEYVDREDVEEEYVEKDYVEEDEVEENDREVVVDDETYEYERYIDRDDY
jgi:hypothetical protein